MLASPAVTEELAATVAPTAMAAMGLLEAAGLQGLPEPARLAVAVAMVAPAAWVVRS